MAVAGVIVFLIFFMSLGGGGSSNDETQNMGQAHHSTAVTDFPGSTDLSNSGATTAGSTNGGYTLPGASAASDEDVKDLGDVVDGVVGDIQEAENEQLAQSQGMLTSAMSSIGNVSNVIHSFL
jgi:hypothetical protein